MNEALSRVKLHWDLPANLDVVRQTISIRVHDQFESRNVELELPYSQNFYEIIVRTPSKIVYSITVTNSVGESTTSDMYVCRAGKSIRPNPPSNLTADIIADDVDPATRLSGVVYDAQRYDNRDNRDNRYSRPDTRPDIRRPARPTTSTTARGTTADANVQV